MMCAYWLQKPNHVMRISEPLECILAKCQPDPPWKMIECPRKSSEANKSDFTPIFFLIIPGPNRHRYHQNTNLKMLLQPLKAIPKQAHSLLARHIFRELYLQDVYIGEWHHPYHHYQQLWYLSSFQCTSCLFLSLSWIHSLQLPKTRGHHLPQRTRRKSRRANRLHLVWWPSLRQGHTETLLNVNWLRNIKDYACD